MAACGDGRAAERRKDPAMDHPHMSGTTPRQSRISFRSLSAAYVKPSSGRTRTMKAINSVERRFRYGHWKRRMRLLMQRMDSWAESLSSIGIGESVGIRHGSNVGGLRSAHAWIIASAPGILGIRA